MQNLKNVRSRSSFLRAEIGARTHFSRYLRTSSTDKDATDRPSNSCLSSSVSSRYFPIEALDRSLASQSRRKASQAFATELSSTVFECPDSQSLTSLCADSQLRRSRDFLSHLPWRVPCTQIGQPHFLCVRRRCGHDFRCLRQRLSTPLCYHKLERIWNAIFLSELNPL